MQIRLAVSLHTPDDELRDTLVPVNERWSVDEVLSAAVLRRHFRPAGIDRVRLDPGPQ
jgi:adenine C2-methylase RlmN of 23S rRNA A2503 and tRNA A37